MYRVSPFMRRFAVSLLSGIGLATIWVNLDPSSYYDMVEWRITDLGALRFLWPNPPSLTPLNLVAEVLIPLFMFLIGKDGRIITTHARGAQLEAAVTAALEL